LLTIHDRPEPRVADAAATKRDFAGRGNGLDAKLATIAGPMVKRFGRGEEPIDFGNASLVELMAFITAFGPVAEIDRVIETAIGCVSDVCAASY
jgi:hypothetical protein